MQFLGDVLGSAFQPSVPYSRSDSEDELKNSCCCPVETERGEGDERGI